MHEGEIINLSTGRVTAVVWHINQLIKQWVTSLLTNVAIFGGCMYPITPIKLCVIFPILEISGEISRIQKVKWYEMINSYLYVVVDLDG